MSQLVVRPMFNDHIVIADLLARPSQPVRALRPPIGQLVVDAHVAERRPQFAAAASEAGIPLVVDPLTPLLQSEVDPDDSWMRLPYAVSDRVAMSEIDPTRLVESVVQHELDNGATAILAPYLYASSPDDRAFETSIQLIRRTRQVMEAERLDLPLYVVFAGQLQSFGRTSALAGGIERFMHESEAAGTSVVGLCLSPLGHRDDSYSKLSAMAALGMAAKSYGPAIWAWRQGIYGPALCAIGLDGYETGIGIGEQTNVKRMQSTRKTKSESGSRPIVQGIYLEPLGRSVPLRVANRLLGSIQMRARVVCDDPACCPDVNSMIDNRRQHAVRSRARFLAEMNQQPHRRWRLNHVARHARTAVNVARQADRLLQAEGARERIGTKNLEALERVASELASTSGQATA